MTDDRGRAFVAGVVFVLVTVVPAAPAAAGHGAVSYENAIKARETKRKEAEAAERAKQPPAAKPSSAPAATAPPAASPSAMAVPAGGDRDHAFATAAHRELSELVRLAEDQIANGNDAALKKLAKDIVEEHRAEVAELDAWLAEHPQPVSRK